jgi:pyrimidine deaminase RibD-like protein/riboflavin biosynthesis pyrimidine reductase
VRDGQIVGEGATQPPGAAHAEIVALRAAGTLARQSTLYVTLEPCAHYGRTPPCADALVAAGIAEAHVAMLDPSPWVNGNGIAALEQAGITVRHGSHEPEARRLNEAYLCWLQRGRPLVTARYALGLDGRPRPLDAAALGPSAGAELARLRRTADRTVTALDGLLAEDPALTGLAAGGVTSLHIEAPPEALDALIERGLVDRIQIFLVPTLGGRTAPDIAGDVARSACATGLTAVAYERLGDAVLVTGSLPESAPPDPTACRAD